MSETYTIERLTWSDGVADADVTALGELLVDAVKSGAAVSFMDTLEPHRAETWWRGQLAQSPPRAGFFVARDGEGTIVGTVNYQPAWAPNQPHRAEICKLMVHRRCRGAGVATRLMEAAEAHALHSGFTLLTLDAKRGGAAIELYRKRGWTEAGIIPNFAVDPDGKALHDTVYFYKQLGPHRIAANCQGPWREISPGTSNTG